MERIKSTKDEHSASSSSMIAIKGLLTGYGLPGCARSFRRNSERRPAATPGDRQPLLGWDVVELVRLVDEEQAIGVGYALGDMVLLALLEKVGPNGQRYVGIARLGIDAHALDDDAEIVG